MNPNSINDVYAQLDAIARLNPGSHFQILLDVSGRPPRHRTVEYVINHWPGRHGECVSGEGTTLGEAWTKFDLALNGTPPEGDMKEVAASTWLV